MSTVTPHLLRGTCFTLGPELLQHQQKPAPCHCPHLQVAWGLLSLLRVGAAGTFLWEQRTGPKTHFPSWGGPRQRQWGSGSEVPTQEDEPFHLSGPGRGLLRSGRMSGPGEVAQLSPPLRPVAIKTWGTAQSQRPKDPDKLPSAPRLGRRSEGKEPPGRGWESFWEICPSLSVGCASGVAPPRKGAARADGRGWRRKPPTKMCARR